MNTTSADTRKIRAYIANLDSAKRQVVEAVIALVERAAPEAELTYKWNMPVFVCSGLLCFVAAHERHVNLGFYQGAHLADPDGLLSGTGKGVRHVKIHKAGDIRRGQFNKWIKEAIRINTA